MGDIEIPRLYPATILSKACQTGGFARYNDKVTSEKPFGFEIIAGDKKLSVKLAADITDVKAAKDIAFDLMLKAVYPEWELRENAVPYADKVLVEDLSEDDVAERTQKARSEMETRHPERVARINASTDRDEEEKQRIITEMDENLAEWQQKFDNQGWPAQEELQIFEDAVKHYGELMFMTFEQFPLTAEWEFKHSSETEISGSVSISKKPEKEGDEPEFLFKIEHAEDYDESTIRALKAGRGRGRKVASVETKKERLLRRSVAESVLKELVEAGVIEKLDSALEKVKERRAANDGKGSRKRRGKRGGKNAESGGSDSKPKTPKVTKKEPKKQEAKKQEPKKQDQKRDGRNRSEGRNRGQKRGNSGPIYREQQPKYMNNAPPAQYAPQMMVPQMVAPQQQYYRQPAGYAPSAPQGGNTAMGQQHSQELQRLQQQQMQAMQTLMAQQQAQYQQAQSNINNRGRGNW